jgi:hypothetical protein
MLGMAMIAGMLGVGAATANAAQVQVQVGYDGRYAESYVPAGPGEGYVWVAGYYNGGYWVPGAWVFRGHRDGDRGYAYGRDFRYDRDRRYEERRFDGNRDRRFDDRRSDYRSDRGREFDGDHRGRR